jgi:hypothetical protein
VNADTILSAIVVAVGSLCIAFLGGVGVVAIAGFIYARTARFWHRIGRLLRRDRPAPQHVSGQVCECEVFRIVAAGIAGAEGDVNHAMVVCDEHGTISLRVGEDYDDFVEEYKPRWAHGEDE